MSFVIDLDAVVAEAPTVRWEGKEYKVADIPVEMMLELTRQARDAEEDDTGAVWESLSRQVRQLVPDAPAAFYETLGLRQTVVLINAIVQDSTALSEGNLSSYIRQRVPLPKAET